jgi:hypothetical protein
MSPEEILRICEAQAEIGRGDLPYWSCNQVQAVVTEWLRVLEAYRRLQTGVH